MDQQPLTTKEIIALLPKVGGHKLCACCGDRRSTTTNGGDDVCGPCDVSLRADGLY
ncbi:hypothetical protein ACFV4N_32480 [Actinosynnema sp. NPDC059797]